MTERTLVLIKPDASLDGEKILLIKEYLTRTGLRIEATKLFLRASQELASNHYVDLGTTAGQAIKEMAIDSLNSGPVIAMIVEGENAITEVRKIIGSTDPSQALPGTIRHDLSDDSLETAHLEGRAVRNVVHAADSPTSAVREIALWFPESAIQ